MIRIMLLCGTLAFFTACPGNHADILFTEVYRNYGLSNCVEGNYVINTVEEYEDAIGEQEAAAFPVDFTQKTVIGVMMGVMPNGCYDIEIVSVKANETEVLAYVVRTTDDGSGACTQALICPKHFVSIEKTLLPVYFR